VMSEMGKAMMGTGEASGEGRATQAAEAAINNPLLDDISMHGARAVLINVTGGMDMTLFEVDEAANRIRREIDVDSVIIFGSTFDEKLDGVMRVSIVATGIEAAAARRETPTFIQAPTTRRSTVISAPTAVPPAPAIAKAETETAAGDAIADEARGDEADTGETAAADMLAAKLPEAPAAPDQVLAATGKAEPATAASDEAEESPEARADDSAAKEEPYVPAFVPTKASRLAFLSNGKAAPRELPLPRRTADTDADGDEAQMSLEHAIAAERATAFASGMPAETPAADSIGSDHSAAGTADAAREPVMVADSAEELATRRPFVPAAPADMPDAEAVPEAVPAGGKTSLINKISGLWTSKSAAEEGPSRVDPAVETAGETDTGAAAPSILDLPRADAMSRMPEPASTTALDSQTDDLEIPAFLRRQAN